MRYSQSRMAAVALALVVASSTLYAVAAVSYRSSETLEKEHITNGPIAEYVSDAAVEIAWSTRGPAELSIRYGSDRDHLDKVAEPVRKGRGHCHHARINGLQPDTTYYFQVVDTDQQAIGELGTFQTLKQGAPPVTRRVIVP